MYFCNFIKKVVAQRKEWCRLRSRKRHNKITTLRFLLFSHLEFSTLENKNLNNGFKKYIKEKKYLSED